MTSSTTNLNLKTYNITTDGSTLAATYIEDISGSTPASNMSKIDAFAGKVTGSLTEISASAVNLSASLVYLTLPTGVTSGSYNTVQVDILGRITTASNVDSSSLGGGARFTNKSGSNLLAGTVAIYNTNYNQAFTISGSDVIGSPAVCGVLYENVANDAAGILLKTGNAPVKVIYNVSRGNWLKASRWNGYAEDAGTNKRPTSGCASSIVGIALTGYSGGGSGSVLADINIYPYCTIPILRQMPSSASFAGTIGASTIFISHTVDVGTDLLVIRGRGLSGRMKFNDITPIKLMSSNVDIYFIKNPPIGTYSFTMNNTAGTATWLYMTNYSGTQPYPFRTYEYTDPGTATVITSNPVSKLNDIVIDVISAPTTWTVNSTDQVLEATTGSTDIIQFSKKNGLDGTTVMSWNGASTGNVWQAAVAIAASPL